MPQSASPAGRSDFQATPVIHSHLMRCVAVLATLCVVDPAVAGSEPAGFVLGVKGAPMTTDASGMTRRARALQDVHDGETAVLERGDVLTVCDPAHGSFEVNGPGMVRLGAPPTALAGSPRVVGHGPCEDATAADGNGGVILRHLGLHGKARTAAGQ